MVKGKSRSKEKKVRKSKSRSKASYRQSGLDEFNLEICDNQKCDTVRVKKAKRVFLDIYPEGSGIDELIVERQKRRGKEAGKRPVHLKYQSPDGRMLSAPHHLDELIPRMPEKEKYSIKTKKGIQARKQYGKEKDKHQLADKRSAVDKTPSENILYFIAKNDLRNKDPEPLWILSYGVGQDSTTILCEIANHNPEFKKYWKNGRDKEFLVLFSDTGCEMPYTYDFYPDSVAFSEKAEMTPVVLEKGSDPEIDKVMTQLDNYSSQMRKAKFGSPEYREVQKKRLALKKKIYTEDDVSRYEQFHTDTALDYAFMTQPQSGIPTRIGRSCTDKHKIQPIRKTIGVITDEAWGINNSRGWVKGNNPPHNVLIGFNYEEAHRAMPSWYWVQGKDKKYLVKGAKGRRAVQHIINGKEFNDLTKQDLINVRWKQKNPKTNRIEETKLERNLQVELKKGKKVVEIVEIDEVEYIWKDIQQIRTKGTLQSDKLWQMNHFPLIKAKYGRKKEQMVNSACGLNCGISGCFCCPFQSVSKFWAVKQLYPEEYERSVNMENESTKYNKKLSLIQGQKLEAAVTEFEKKRKATEKKNPQTKQWMSNKQTKKALSYEILGEQVIEGFDRGSSVWTGGSF